MESTISHCRLIVAEPSYGQRRKARLARRIERARSNLARADQEAPSEARLCKPYSRGSGLGLLIALGAHVAIAYLVSLSPAPALSVRQEAVRFRVLPVASRSLPEVSPPIVPKPVKAPPKRSKSEPSTQPSVSTEAEAAPAMPEPQVGLTLDSTEPNGLGAAFAVGETLAGETLREAPPPVSPRPLEAIQVAPVPRPSRNRVARVAPPAFVHVEPARRLSRIEPDYPALLRNQGLEGDVTVQVLLSAQGRVQEVSLVRPAKDDPFNSAALSAARREQFAPETHDGRPVSTSLTYTYRFRIDP